MLHTADIRSSGQFVGQGVDEVVLARIARQIGEGQDDDRKTRRLTGRLRGDACGPVRIEEPPRAARNDNQQRRERRGERRDPETPLLRRGRCGRYELRRLRLCRHPHLQRISANLPVDVLELGRAKVDDLHLEPAAHLSIGILRKTNCARRSNALKPRGDIDAVAHEVAIRLLDDIADVNPDAEVDSPLLRHARIALDEAVLNLDRAADRVDDAAKLDDRAVAGAFDDTAVVGGDGGVDEVAPQTPQARKGPILVGAGEAGISDDVSDQDRRQLPGLAKFAPLRAAGP